MSSLCRGIMIWSLHVKVMTWPAKKKPDPRPIMWSTPRAQKQSSQKRASGETYQEVRNRVTIQILRSSSSVTKCSGYSILRYTSTKYRIRSCSFELNTRHVISPIYVAHKLGTDFPNSHPCTLWMYSYIERSPHSHLFSSPENRVGVPNLCPLAQSNNKISVHFQFLLSSIDGGRLAIIHPIKMVDWYNRVEIEFGWFKTK